jgi:hypothetical protein
MQQNQNPTSVELASQTSLKKQISESDFLAKDSREPIEKQIVLVRSEPKIKDCTNDNLQKKIREVLAYIFIVTGCDPVHKEEKIVLMNGITQCLGKFTPSEIKLAFDLILQGKVGEVSNLNLYGKPFNLAFLCSIMHKYEQFRNPIVAIANKPPEEPKLSKEAVEEKNYEVLKESTIDEWKEYICFRQRNQYHEVNDRFGNKYDFLDKIGLISFTNEIKNQFIEVAKQNIKKEYLSDRAKVIDVFNSNDLEKQYLKRSKQEYYVVRAKELLTRWFFDDVYKQEKDLEQMIVDIEKEKADAKK